MEPVQNSRSTVGPSVLIAAGTIMVALSYVMSGSPTELYSTTVVPTASVFGAPTNARPSMEVFGKGRNAGRRSGQMMGKQKMAKPPTPPVDPDNEEFVMFVRPKQFPTMWVPYTVVTGGSQANQLVKSANGNFATGMFADQLVRSMGEVVYRDQAKIEREVKKIPMLKNYDEFQYGFKVRDKTQPDAWYESKGVIEIPPEDQLPSTPLNKVADGVKGVADKLGFGNK